MGPQYPGIYAKVSLRVVAPAKAQMVPDDALVGISRRKALRFSGA